MRASHCGLLTHIKDIYPRLLAENVYAGISRLAVNIPSKRLKNMVFVMALFWELNEFHVAGPVAGSDTTLFLDNLLNNGKIIIDINYKRIFV